MSDETVIEGAQEPRRRRAAPEADPLAGTEFEGLPEIYHLRHDDGSQIHERAPTYLCRADCFLGSGREATLYEESSIVVTNSTPNEHMEPLNRAAGIAYVTWLQDMPQQGVPIDIGDMAEAAQMLAVDPDHTKLNKITWQEAVTKLATKLKLKRLGKDARAETPMGHNFARGTRSTAPPILGAKLADMSQRFPGETRFATAVPAFGTGPVTRRAVVQPMNLPNGR